MGILFTITMGILFTITMGFLFTIVLGIQLTISKRVKLDVDRHRVDVWAGHAEGLRWACPECGEMMPFCSLVS